MAASNLRGVFQPASFCINRPGRFACHWDSWRAGENHHRHAAHSGAPNQRWNQRRQFKHCVQLGMRPTSIYLFGFQLTLLFWGHRGHPCFDSYPRLGLDHGIPRFKPVRKPIINRNLDEAGHVALHSPCFIPLISDYSSLLLFLIKKNHRFPTRFATYLPQHRFATHIIYQWIFPKTFEHTFAPQNQHKLI